MEESKEVFGVFFVTWIVLGVFSWLFFTFYKNIPFKRKILPLFLIFVGLLFIFFLYLMGSPAMFYWIAVPGVLVITALNMYAIRFCDECGKVFNKFPFQNIRYCAKCGAKLTS